MNINRNYQGDLAETQFEFAGHTYKSMKSLKTAIQEKYKSEIGLSFRNPDHYIIDASNRLSPNLDTQFNITGKDSELGKVRLYRDYHGLAVDNENLVKEVTIVIFNHFMNIEKRKYIQ